MALAAGTKLGPYEILAPLGSGGMGEVYRARDVRLERTVAVKILSSQLSENADLKSRFEREARTISCLNHPNICHLYDVGSQSGTDYLVMELLEGETLADRLLRGPLPLNQVLKLAIEITDALDKAHRQGIVHRDLKPGNIMLTKSGGKLLDFGLAKPTGLAAAANAGSATLVNATMSSSNPVTPLTSAGMVVGTIQYMSPEQIQGKEADARSDIFAFGAMLYEMASARRAFCGKSPLSVASAILERNPEPITTIVPAIPKAMEHIVTTCLSKDPEDRFHTAHDIKIELQWLQKSGTTPVPSPRPALGRNWPLIAIGFLAVLAVAAALIAFTRKGSSINYSIKFSIPMSSGMKLATDLTQSLALSPDGKQLAYVAMTSGVSRLYVRALDDFAAIEIPDSESSVFPFFSPDGNWVAFFSHGKLKKASSNGGAPVPICDIPSFFGGTWLPDGHIVFAVPGAALASVSAEGGTPEKLSLADTTGHSPSMPTSLVGDWIGFTDISQSEIGMVAFNRKSGELRPLIKNAEGGMYAHGRIVYYSGGAIWAVPFDSSALVVRGTPVQLATGVDDENFVAQFAVSEAGILAFAPGLPGTLSRRIYTVDRSGREHRLDLQSADYVDTAFAPDGQHFALIIRTLGEQQLAVFDLNRGVLMRILANGARSAAPAWTSDGRALVFDSVDSKGNHGIYRIAADGSSVPQLLHELSQNSHVSSIAGDRAAVMVNDPMTSIDLWLLNLTPNYTLQPYRRTAAMERQGSLSPDGQWMAYASNESGRSEIYVEPVPGPGGRWQLSAEGGEQPHWSRNGREVFYRNGTKMMSVPVETRPKFRVGKPSQLFDAEFDRGGAIAGYDVSPDGQTFLMTRSDKASPTEIRVVVSWPERFESQSGNAKGAAVN